MEQGFTLAKAKRWYKNKVSARGLGTSGCKRIRTEERIGEHFAGHLGLRLGSGMAGICLEVFKLDYLSIRSQSLLETLF